MLKLFSTLQLFTVLSACQDELHEVNDVTGLNPVVVSGIIHPTTEIEIINAVEQARIRKIHISIAGAKHSQGRQTSYPDALVLDMRSFSKVLEVDAVKKTIRVQTGATWEQVQNAVSPLGLSVQVQQASNIFTVGGSLSVNIHGWDPRFHQFVSTVESFRMINANGKLMEISRKENAELFRWVIGGYGLFGVITDVTLHLTDNHLLSKEVVEIPLEKYPEYFEKEVAGNSSVELHYARPSIHPSKLFKTALVSTLKVKSNEPLKEEHLPDEDNKLRNFWVFQISRYFRIPGLFDLGKPFRWWLQKKFVDVPGKVVEISRNRAMRPEIQFTLLRSGFFHTDILQEYFIPKANLITFMDSLKKIVLEHHMNLLSVTVRPIHKDTETGMPYARFEGFAVVLYINLLTTPGRFFSENWGEARAQVWTREIVDLAALLGGTFYLPYQRYVTRDQIHLIYPQLKELTRMKQKYDPENLFLNQFYETYK